MKLCQLIFFLLSSTAALATVAPNFTYYHTTDEINAELLRLNGSCNGMVSLTVILEDPLIYAVNVANPELDPASLTKSFFIFGEHPRELISPETGLYLLLQLCGEVYSSIDIDTILQTNQFVMVLNSNPYGRKEVENGSYCQRTNEDGVDLNRNWDDHWETYNQSAETYPGPEPFSEPETRALRDVFNSYEPTIFLSVHSGNLGMYTPYAYWPIEGKVNEQQMLDILNELNPTYCSCNFGGAAQELGSECTGTCLDYAYDHRAPYSFAFEIYNQYNFAPGWDPQASLLQIQSAKSKNLRGAAPVGSTASCFVQTKSQQIAGGMTDEECLVYFNPLSEEEYNFVVNNWATAILEMVSLVNKQLNSTATAT